MIRYESPSSIVVRKLLDSKPKPLTPCKAKALAFPYDNSLNSNLQDPLFTKELKARALQQNVQARTVGLKILKSFSMFIGFRSISVVVGL